MERIEVIKGEDFMPLKEITPSWNYNDSVSKVKSAVYKWKNLTIGIMRELSVAHKKLVKSGKRTDLNLGANAPKLKTWSNYCDDIGIDRKTVYRWLEHYNTLIEQGTLEVGADSEMKMLVAPKKQETEKSKREEELEKSLMKSKELAHLRKKEMHRLKIEINELEDELLDLRELKKDKKKVEHILKELHELEKRRSELFRDAEGLKAVSEAIVQSRNFFTKELSVIPALYINDDTAEALQGDMKALVEMVKNWLIAIEDKFKL